MYSESAVGSVDFTLFNGGGIGVFATGEGDGWDVLVLDGVKDGSVCIPCPCQQVVVALARAESAS